ncbi:MAG TPA: non-canonical purine NTP pyrophosphatase [Terriglobia bacterium]|nr:non-canonical purine NTP pyrophosphatase [Terriglobia bacterium]
MRDPLQLWLASTSSGKLREFREAGLVRGVRVEALPGITAIAPCVEDGSTFEENARKKALYYSRAAEGLVFADDSGLCVDALGGAPGVFSARFAGEGASDSANNFRLIEELRRTLGSGNWRSEVTASTVAGIRPRTAAHYVCVIALAERGRILTVTVGRADGTIIEQPRGSGGFGYDPYFFYSPLDATFAELSPEAKFAVSHRGEAFRKLLDYVENSTRSERTAEAVAVAPLSGTEHRRE